ncbi:MAG: aquaporin family protein [Promicromonosporaceae bacterium]|nr:aquaporin family protein [Promicromonosporaceae bacterium]
MTASAFWSELAGTGVLLLLGVGLNANIALRATKGHGKDWLLTSLGWGLAVFAAVFVAADSGAHLNPAVTLGKLILGQPFHEVFIPFAREGCEVWMSSCVSPQIIEPTILNALVYVAAQLLGAFLGATLAWLAYKKHYDLPAEPGVKLGTFATGPALRTPLWNTVTEAIGTFALVYWVLVNRATPHELGPLAVALVVVAIGAGLGGPTGYAINPARDLGPRLAHAVLPIPEKGSSDWGYAWVPVAGPALGATAAALLSLAWT